MTLVLIGALILAAGVAWLVGRRAKARQDAPRTARIAGSFGSVEIRTRKGACEAARSLEGQRFLSKEAPALPLTGCAAPQCSCSFAKLSDRRTDSRRLEHGGLSASFFQAVNRRAERERRRASAAPKRP
jgi:hypothetical protein